MRRLLRSFCVAALVLSGGHAAMAEPACWPNALAHLRAAAPDGFAIYQRTSQPDFFKSWIDCGDPQFDLSTAVHESTHFITSETDAFPLVGGGAVARPHEVSAFFPPYRIAKKFAAGDFVTVYLARGKASSSTDFLYLLDELNAYSHDLNAAVNLKDLTRTDQAVDHRDGLAALMAFVAVYAQAAKESEPATWRGLRAPVAAKTIAALWGQAERVMASSCGIPNYGSVDVAYVRSFCAAPAQAALQQILNRAPVCPTACLAPSLDVAEASDDVTATIPQRRQATHRRHAD